MQSNAHQDSKKHYLILDGLRGIAAVMVVAFHLLEIFSGGKHENQIINHGYLAVDFFFALSGFVIGYAYDDRWKSMTTLEFFKRRLVRLHPMIIVGMAIGALLFYSQQSPALFPNIAGTPLWKLILVMLLGFTLIPVGKSLDIRGWDEMHPLNGPAWSLFFEYIANIFYGLFLRKITNQLLGILVIITALVTLHFSLTNDSGDLIGGWSIAPEQLRVGFTRLAYPFLAGLLLSRINRSYNINNAFLWCILLLIVALALPRIGTQHWQNGLYDALCVIFVFPYIVYMGANGDVGGHIRLKVCKFLGDISYPIYIIHYPFIYWFSAWVTNNKISMEKAFPMGVAIWTGTILLSWILFKYYDVPVRKWLTKRFLYTKKTT